MQVYQCLNCNHEVSLDKHGRCSDCGSVAVAAVEQTFAQGSRENHVVRETKRTIEHVNRVRKWKRFFTHN